MSGLKGFLTDLAAHLGQITKENDWLTDIGEHVLVGIELRDPANLPGISIAARSGQLSLAGEAVPITRAAFGPKARRARIELAAAMTCSRDDAQGAVLDMLTDLDRALAKCIKPPPEGIIDVTLETWDMGEWEAGGDVAVLNLSAQVIYFAP